MEIIETLTPEEATELLRSMGMRISPNTIREGLRQNRFPFGDVIETGHCIRCYVYKKLLDQWIAERSTEKPDGE